MSDAILIVNQLHKKYAARTAVSGVSFSASAGQVIGLLGPNGAGKTTTVAMICGLVAPDSGSVLIDGDTISADNNVAKKRIGLVPQDIALYEDLSAISNLELFGALYGVEGALLKQRCADVLQLVGLTDRAKDKPSTFSGGMKRRLNIAAALIHDPDVILLDEPTVGVDPQSRNAIFDNLETLKARGKTLIYTTHYMEEAERLCDHIVIIDEGKVIASDTLANLYRLLPAVEKLMIEVDGTVDTAQLAREPGIKSVTQSASILNVGVDSIGSATQTVLTWLTTHGHTVHTINSGRATLENVFLSLTGRQLRD